MPGVIIVSVIMLSLNLQNITAIYKPIYNIYKHTLFEKLLKCKAWRLGLVSYSSHLVLMKYRHTDIYTKCHMI